MKIWKKTMSLLITMVLTFVVVGFLPHSNVDATTTSRTYYVYNAITGAKFNSRTYTLNPLSIPSGSGSSGTNSVIGTDDRVIDYTKSGVVKIITGSGGIGSGFVVDDHTIATAGHVVYSNDTGSQTVSHILLFNTSGVNVLDATPIEYHVPYDFISRLVPSNQPNACATNEYDYALITVEEDLSNYACFYLGAPLDEFMSTSSALTVSGFPGKVNNITVNTLTTHALYSGNGTILNYNYFYPDKQIFYNVDMTPGDSGGPAYITTSYYGSIYYTVIGINVSEAGTYNIATRITSDLLHFYLNNSNQVYNVSMS